MLAPPPNDGRRADRPLALPPGRHPSRLAPTRTGTRRGGAGPHAEALGYSECRSKGHHVDDAQAAYATAFAEPTTTGLQEAIDADALKR